MLIDDIKARMFQAMKAGDVVAKEVLRVAMGEITTDAARDGRKGDDEEARALVKKLAKSIEETRGQTTDPDKLAALTRELEVLSEFLPKSLSEDDVAKLLEPVADAVRAAPNDGAATGVAMKHLKASGAAVEGKVVGAAVRKLRG
jgi:uncharacterized protein YqeY